MSKRSLISFAACLILGLSAVVFFVSRKTTPVTEKLPNASHAKMLSTLEGIARRTPDENPYLGDISARRLRQDLGRLPANALAKRADLSFALAEREISLGREEEALALYERAREISPGLLDRLPQHFSTTLAFQLGVAYMRRGETQNCCQMHTPDSCVLPIQGDGIHKNGHGSRRAIELFEEVLRTVPGRSQKRYESLWLLNIAYMTLGGYPDRVPPEYLLPESAFQPSVDFPRLENIAGKLGLDTFGLAGGVIADDFDNDGFFDLMVSNWDVRGQIRFFHSRGDGGFDDRTEQAGLKGIYGGLNLVHADYDNDGFVDVLVLRGGWWENAGRHPNSLLRNQGNGTFVDVSFDAFRRAPHYPTQTAGWADYDNDGDLDLYVGNETTPKLRAPSQLFRNNGDGTFTDVASRAKVTNDRFTKGVTWGDFDGDRYPDIYVSNMDDTNRLYRNNRDGTFTDVAKQSGVFSPRTSFPCWFWDFNHDGHLDLYVSAYSAAIEHLAAEALKHPYRTQKAKLYQGDGKGGFIDVAQRMGWTRPVTPMGANFGDIDHDGLLDCYLGTGYPRLSGLMPSVLYVNRGDRFDDVTLSSRMGNLQKGHGVAFVDLDNDGDQDVFEQMGGAFPGDGYYDALYENPGFGNHWISIQLVGVRSNRSAIGARIRIEVQDVGRKRVFYRHVNSGGSFGGNPLRQTIGLGGATRIDVLEVHWPTSDTTQTFLSVAVDRGIRIVEGEKDYTQLELEKIELRPY